MAKESSRWFVVTAVLAVAVCVVLGALLIRRGRDRAQASSKPAVSPAPSAPCEVPALSFGGPGSSASNPLVVLGASEQVRLFLDGSPVLADLERPPVVTVGEHELKVEAPGQKPVSTRFRVAPYVPAVFHAELDPKLGISIARLGTICTTCKEALDVARLVPPIASREKADALLSRAAEALRRDDWKTAAAALQAVPGRDRSRPAFLRLASIVFSDSHGAIEARASLEQAARRSPSLKATLAAFDRATDSERARRTKLLVGRWNRVTDRFATFSQKFEPLARNQFAAASERMVKLTPAFQAGLDGQDGPAMESAARAAEETLVQLASQLRGLKPSDCAFQNEIAAALLQ